jgi:preprotein translocase subunit SecB
MHRAFSSKVQASLMLKSPSMLAPSFLANNQYEVTLNLAAKATANDTALFLVDLAYAGLVSPQGTPE